MTRRRWTSHPPGAPAPGSCSPTPTRGRRVEALLLAKGGKLWEQPLPAQARSLEFSSDGTRLLALLDGRDQDPRRGPRHAARRERRLPTSPLSPTGPARRTSPSSTVSKVGSRVTLGGRVLFSFGGELRGLTWSPDGRWLLVGVPASDQWVFIRADGTRIVAVSNVSEQFHSQSFPRVEGWCCA